jgi:hypothetical protein
LVFQVANGARKRGLVDMHALSGTAKVKVLGDGNEIAQVS